MPTYRVEFTRIVEMTIPEGHDLNSIEAFRVITKDPSAVAKSVKDTTSVKSINKLKS